MWIFYALLVHILLLGSIFVIYFRSPVLQGLTPQEPLPLEAPANRLVLIVTDGLRAESFFRKNCSDIQHLLDLLPHGLVGVSHTRVPTESRPGHIALIAGLYEDPSAVTRGWKENPIDFDTLFNRSRRTYAWGANDVLHIFSRLSGSDMERVHIDAYNHDLDFSGREKTHELDAWVFTRVRQFLERKGADLREQRQTVYFLHLLGLDTAGHVHKPGTELFLENLHYTQRAIRELYDDFERIFPDKRTAYLLTSDHGMTNTGSHGAGDAFETETPFFLWGAGISKPSPSSAKHFQAGKHTKLPLHEIEQAQMAPLMSALIGVPPPMNNLGTLPKNYLNVSLEYAAHAAHSNTLQLLEQYRLLLEQHQRGYFTEYLRAYPLKLTDTVGYRYTTHVDFMNERYADAIRNSYDYMQKALHGIDYYHAYYRNALLLSTSASFIGWICYLLQLLVESKGEGAPRRRPTHAPHHEWWYAAAGVLSFFILLQRVPWTVCFYLLLPFPVWLLVLRKSSQVPWTQLRSTCGGLLLCTLCAELLVYTFYERKFIAPGFLLYAVVEQLRHFTFKDGKFYIWLILVLLIAICPLLPPAVGFSHTPLLFVGVLLTLLRPYLSKARLPLRDRVCATVALVNALICAYQHANQMGISVISQLISWSYLVYVVASLFLSDNVNLKQRVECIFFNFSSLYALLCTSYEALFVLMLASQLTLSLAAQQQAACALPFDAHATNVPRANVRTSFSIAAAILLYTFSSFFGTGNIASVSSFDPNIIRCFLTTFAPFVIMALVILKLIIPVVLNICIIYGLSAYARAHEREIFICLLLICDVMGLNFLFMVRNYGSWLEIGSSISHFVIMEVTTLVLLLLAEMAKLCLRLRLNARSSKGQ